MARIGEKYESCDGLGRWNGERFEVSICELRRGDTSLTLVNIVLILHRDAKAGKQPSSQDFVTIDPGVGTENGWPTGSSVPNWKTSTVEFSWLWRKEQAEYKVRDQL